MRKTVLRRVFLLFLLAAFACVEREYLSDSGKALTVDAARQWYEANRGSKTNVTLRAGKEDKLMLRPKWEHSSSGKNATFEVVETAITSDRAFSIVDDERKGKYEETGDSRYLLSKTTLVVRKNRNTGETEGFLMTIIPDLSYLESTHFEPFKKNSYLERDKKLSGHIFYHDMEGRFVNGWRYEDGKAYAIYPIEGGKDAGIALRVADCVLEIFSITISVQTGELEYENGETIYCIVLTTYTEYLLYYNCSGDIGGGGGGGDYVGSNDPNVIAPGGGGSTSNQSTPTKITSAAKNAVDAVKNSDATNTMKARCNEGVKNAFKEVYGPLATELDNKSANDIVKYWRNSSKWESISLSQAQILANQGWFVVAGWENPFGSGHVVVIVPGTEIDGWPVCMDTGVNKRWDSNGLNYSFGKDKRNDVEYYIYK